MSEESESLFRREVLERQHTRLEGGILIPAQPRLTLISIVAGTLMLSFIGFVVFGHYTRKARLEGLVMPAMGLVKVVAPAEGRVQELLVTEGQQVRQGDPLYRLTSERYDSQGVASSAALRGSLDAEQRSLTRERAQQTELNQTEVQGLVRKQAGLRAELEAAKGASVHAERQVSIMRETVESQRKMAKQGFIPAATFRERESALAAAEARAGELRQEQRRLEREADMLTSDIARTRLSGANRLAELERLARRVEQQLLEASTKGEALITAPVEGTVGTVLVKLGQSVGANEVLIHLVPKDSEFVVELYAPSRAVGFVKPEQPVGLRFAAFPFEKFGVQIGRVRQVTHVALASGETSQRGLVNLKDNEAHYRVIVVLDKQTVTAYGREEALRTGMTVSADVELDTRKIYEWVLEPLWSLRGKV
jgi:membrane fusion protein